MQPACRLVLVACLAVCGTTATTKLPSYITPCQRSNAKLQECALANARAALPFILKGDRKLRTPSLLPVRVTSLEVETPGAIRLKLKFSDMEITGYEQSQIQGMKVDLDAGKLEYKTWIPRWELSGKYDVTGQIILLPITGKGDCNITLEDVSWLTTVSFEKYVQPEGAERLRLTDLVLQSNHSRGFLQLDNLFNGDKLLEDVSWLTTVSFEKYVQPEGPERLRLTDLVLQSNHTRGFLQLDNLFNGDKLLGDQMNKFMNENFSELSAIVSPFLEQAVAGVFRQIFEGIFSSVTMEDIFPE